MKRRLAALKAERLSRVHESNTLYDTREESFAKRGQLVRLRIERGPQGRRALLTLKGPSLKPAPGIDVLVGGEPQGRYKIREEFEHPVHSPALFQKGLEALGYVPTFRYEKYRARYRLPGLAELDVDLDQTPIGNFLELEGPPEAIDRAAALLGYTKKDYLTESYLELYQRDCRRRGVKPGDMLFRKRKK